MIAKPFLEAGDGFGLRAMILVSLLLHAAVLSLVFLSPSFPAPKLTFGPVHTVSLVSLPRSAPGERGMASWEKELAKAGLADDRAETIIKRRLEPSSAAPVIPIRSLEPVKKRETSLDKAMEAIRKRAARMEPAQRPGTRPAPAPEAAAEADAGKKPRTPAPPAGAAAGPVASESQPGGADDRMQAYYSQIWSRIKGGWALPQGILPREVIEAVIDVTILRSGAVTDVAFEKRSGNRYFDESAMKAIRKASPFPPLPAWIGEQSIEVGIRFHSTELQH